MRKIKIQTYYKRAVAKGAALLDKGAPGWESKINLNSLDLEQVNHCVLGQIFGRYSKGRSKLSAALEHVRAEFAKRFKELDPEVYGFDAVDSTYIAAPENVIAPYNRSQGYSILTELWTAEIVKRRALEVEALRRV